jgi:hypothetical protein
VAATRIFDAKDPASLLGIGFLQLQAQGGLKVLSTPLLLALGKQGHSQVVLIHRRLRILRDAFLKQGYGAGV